ncbi:MAG TPA: hypothetical protein QGF35_05115 [Dehalococcoidia bacterium]|nr:hypothetical protein [Dehalococcoidia bacterium]
MRPRADQVVTSVAWTFDRYIVPELNDPFAKSLALSIGYALRNVEQRLREEGPAIWADNREIRVTLRNVRDLVQSTPGASEKEPFSSLLTEIDAALGKEYRGRGDYPTLESITDEATELRWPLVHAIEALRAHSADFEDGAYQGVRAEIRDYLKRQLERESQHAVVRRVAGLDSLAGRV